MKSKYILASLFCLAAFSCSDDKSFEPAYTVSLEADENMTTNVDASQVFQTIDGFASSDAWDMDFIGKYWSNSNKEGIAKLLFSRKIDSKGRPEGIGLSMWRVNVGGGSSEQGDASGIPDKYERRVECFLNQDGSYNWSKQAGQQYFMQKAKEYGCESFVLFTNTPPVWYTKNGLAFPTKGASSNQDEDKNNLKDEHYEDFAEFLATVTKHFVDQGYNIPLISPINEPQVDWRKTPGADAEQEGCSYTHEKTKILVTALNDKLEEKGLATNILLGEASRWEPIYTTNSGGYYSNLVDHYFNPDYKNYYNGNEEGKYYLGNLKHVPNILCAHSYHTDKTWSSLKTAREKAYEKAQQFGVELYQTEWSMLSTDYDNYENYDDASYMDLALSMARVLHHDLATANVRSWSYWTSVSQERWSQKSRFYLIRVSADGKDGEDYGDLHNNGVYATCKNLWVLGNYSLFIRPNFQRVALNLPEESEEFFGSAYISPEKNRVVVVYTNLKSESIHIECGIQGLDGKEVVAVNQYTTSNAKDLKQEPDYLVGHIPAKSVVTVVYDLK